MSNYPPPPPPSGGYMPPPSGGSNAPGGGGGIRIGEWFNEMLALVKPQWVDFWLAFLVAGLTLSASVLCLVIPLFFIMGPILGGLHIFVAKKMMGMPTEIGDVFKGFRRFADTCILGLVIFGPIALIVLLSAPGMLAGFFPNSEIIQTIAGVLGAIAGCISCIAMPLLIVYPIIIGVLMIFAMPLVLFRNMSAIEALRTSISIVMPNLVNVAVLIVANIALGMVAMFVGVLACGIGVLLTAPLASAARYSMQMMAYRDFVGLTREEVAQYAQ